MHSNVLKVASQKNTVHIPWILHQLVAQWSSRKYASHPVSVAEIFLCAYIVMKFRYVESFPVWSVHKHSSKKLSLTPAYIVMKFH